MTDSIRHKRDETFKQRERNYLSFIRDFNIGDQDPELFKVMKGQGKKVYDTIFDKFDEKEGEIQVQN